METLEVRSLLAGDTVNQDSLDTILSSSAGPPEDTSAIIQSLIESGAIAASPSPGLATPGDFQGNALQPIVTDSFSQAVPSNDWWSSVHFAEYGDSFSAPLFIHPITAKASETGLSISAQTIQSAFETGPTLREYQVAYVADLHIDLFGMQSATQFALDSYSDWAFTGKWNGVDGSPSATMAQGSPMVWIEDANLDALQIRWDDGAGSVSIEGNTATFTVADRTYGLYAPEGSLWQVSGQSVTLDDAGSGTVAVALLPDTETETLSSFREAANHPISSTHFGYSRGADPYSLKLQYDYNLGGGSSSGETVVALYPHLARHTQIDTLSSSAYQSARGSMVPVKASSIEADLAARGVLPGLPSTLDATQRETLRQLLVTDEAATNPSGYFSRFTDPYWSGKSLLKLMQLSQVADLVGETGIRDDIHQAVKDGLGDWFHFNGNANDRHFAYNAEWDTLQGYPDAFYSGQMLNDHHFHMGYLIHSAALLGMSDPAWAAENQAIIDLIIKDVAGTDAGDSLLPRLRNFSPMAGHSWASGHGAFSRGNNHESSSEAMNFATGLMLWGEVTRQTDTTLLGQTLYSLEAEAIAEYWFDKYGTTYPEAFDVESVGMVWGDGAAHATWFSAEVEMIKAINFLPFHGGSLYLSEMARDGEAVIDEITELNGGPPDVWQSLISQYEALVNPVEAWNNFSLDGIQPEEGQSPAFTYYWMATLANLGTPTSAIRGDHPLSAVFQNGETNTYTAHNAGSETITVTFNDGVAFTVEPGTTRSTTGSASDPVDPPADPPESDPDDDLPLPPVAPDPGVAPPALEDLEDGQTLMLVGQTFQQEYTDFIDGTGLTPAGSSHYATFYLGQIEQGDDSPDAAFLDYVRDNDLGDYAMVALSFKDNTPAGGYGQMINQDAADYDSNALWEALNDIRGGVWDAQIDSFAQTMANRPDTQFLLRVGYEVSLLLFAYNGDQYVVDWLNDQASAGINVFDNPDAVPELDRSAFIDAYNHIVDRIESQASNVEFGYHPVRGYNDTQWLYPGEENVDWVGFSVFNNDVGMEVNGTINAPDERIDPNLALSMDFARMQGHEIVIAESTAQNPAASDPDLFIEYLDRLDDVVEQYDVAALTYINSDWPAHGWGPEWGDSRVEVNPVVETFFLDTFGAETRYLYTDLASDPVDPPADPPVDFVQILDDGDAGFSQTGFDYLANPGRPGYGTDWHRVRANSGAAEAQWTFTDLPDGTYRISATWQANGTLARTLDAPYTIRDATDTVLTTVSVNQQIVPGDRTDAGADWHDLATVTVSGGTLVVGLNESPTGSGQVLADAMRVERVDAPADPVDPPADPPAEDVTYGFGLLEPGGPDAYATTGFDQGEFLSSINFSHRATADPLVAPGNPNFWHAHDFFVNPSTDAYSTIESLMAVDGSSALPANNESVYWVPSMINETTGQYVTPLDSSIAYYRITRPFDPGKLEAMPTGLSVIAGAAMPSARQSIGVVAWNYIGSSERYDHLPIGDEWQDLPLQALIYFPMFWDGENLDSANHKSHMAYADAAGGPSTHPYLLPQLELQIHYGRIPQDAQLMLTSDYMTQDHPDFAPGWSLHADHIHLPWPEYDDDGNLYDGFERRVTDSMRFPIFAGTDGNSVRTIPTGATQPFTPEPFYTYPVFPGQDNSDVPDTTAPILVTASPTDGSVDVPVNTEIVLVFDENVVAGGGMLHLMTGPVDDPLTTPVESHTSVEMFAATDPRVQIDGNRVRVALQSTLDPDTTYHLDIGSGGDAFLDLAGNGYQRDHADYNFTTTDGVGVDFTITWPGSDVWMGVGNTSTIYGQVNNVTDVVSMNGTIQNIETGLYQRTDGTFGAAEAFEITVNTYDGHWFFLHTPAAGGTYRVEVFATDRAQTVTSRSATFSVHGDLPSGPADPPVEDPPVEDPPVTDPPASGPDLDLVAETTSVSLLVDPETGLAYVQDLDGEPILISRSDDYWSGDVPLTRDGSSLQAAARDELGRLRVLDIGEWGAFAWILDESGLFVGEEGPTDSSVEAKEILFQFDLNGDGVIGQTEETTPPATPPADPDPGGDVLADGVQVRLMTFNVYYASLGAAERIDGIAQAIADYTPDVASIQEMWGEKDQILAAIEAKTGLDYAFSTGSNTWDGDILYRADRWRILDDGVITYDGSRGMSYATLEHLSTGEKMSVYGMHPLAGVSEDVHLRNIEMATEHMAASAYAGEAPVVLLGDMNAHENSESMRLIRDGSLNAFGQNWSAPVTFEDTFRVANGDAADGNTGFGVKIDYVYIEESVDPAFRVEGASIRNDAPGGSDHFPVMAEVVLLF